MPVVLDDMGEGGNLRLAARFGRVLCLGASASALCLSGCSLLFSEELAPPSDVPRPEIRFDFEGSDTEALRSSGTIDVELFLSGEARIERGTLDLSGVSLGGAGSASTVDGVPAFANACRNSGEFSVSLWFTPGDNVAIDNTPARILTMEENESAATNFTIGQGPNRGDTGVPEDFDRITYRAATRANSGAMEARKLGLALGEATWVGYSATAAGANLWVKSPSTEQVVEVSTDEPPGIATWEPSFPLVFGSTPTGRRQWRGKIFHIELFCTALSGDTLAALADASAPVGG